MYKIINSVIKFKQKTQMVWLLILGLTLSVSMDAHGQSIGLVLSGGGAKGLYHVGVIKALEENGIPIDYVAGASQGAIVSAMYATGFSPDEMIHFFCSDSVETWLKGKIPEEYSYFFKRFDPTPEMISVRINPDTTSFAAIKIPTNIISPYMLDLAFIRMIQGASSSVDGNFDDLMVPFRCVASDVFNKELITFSEGSLPFAVRASMSIPLVFKPMQMDSILLYDGGVLNNFPWQILEEDFEPDMMIGSVCVGNAQNPSPGNLMSQLMSMIMTPTDYTMPDSSIMLRRVFNDIGTLDYNKAPYIIDMGYKDAIAMMPSIKEKIKRRVSPEELYQRRLEFKAKIKPLVFEDIEIYGMNEVQTQFVRRQLGLHMHNMVTMDYFEERYLRLLATGIYTGEFPEVTYNKNTGFYKMKIKVTTKPNLKLSLGGNISSTSLNQLYLGLSYQKVGRHVSSYSLGAFLGTFFNGVNLQGRYDFHTNFPFYVDYGYRFEKYNRNTFNSAPYYRNKAWRYVNQTNNYLTSSLSMPFLDKWAARAGILFGITSNDYFTRFHTSADKSNNTRFSYGRVKLEIEAQSAEFVMFQRSGLNQLMRLRYTMGLESFRKGTVYGNNVNDFTNKNRNWFDFTIKHEQYINTRAKWFTFGYLAEGMFSNIPSFGNYYARSMMAPSFKPTFLSRTIFMPEYTSANYIALGVIPIFNIVKDLYIKSYVYMFMPQSIIYDTDWIPIEKTWNSFKNNTEYIMGGSIIYQTPIGPASITIDKYTTGPSNWNFVFNFGFALFNKN